MVQLTLNPLNTMKTYDLKTALLQANNESLVFKGRKYRLDCTDNFSPYYKREVFSCCARNMTPKTPDEEKYCIIDLWQSESDDSGKLMMKFARLGGYAL